MLLLSAGCSLISGYELSDWGQGQPHSLLVWPALWAKSAGYEYKTVAENGLSNESIARQVIHYCENNTLPDMIIVQWTYLCRYEIRLNHKEQGEHFQQLSSWSYIVDDHDVIVDRLSTRWLDLPEQEQKKLKEDTKKHLDEISKSAVGKIANVWYELMNCRETELYHSLRAVSYLKNYLENNQINYTFSMSEETLLPDETIVNDVYIKDLIKQVKTAPWIMFGEKNLGFTRWAEDQKFKIGPLYHPLEDAHYMAYELAKDRLHIASSKTVNTINKEKRQCL
jgi:hypothetical protein